MELPYSEAKRSLVHYPRLDTVNEAIVIPSQVSYSSLSASLQSADDEFSGIWRTVSQILTYGWLWNEVRVKNGAYGTSFTPAYSGLVSCMSYRDPNVKRSLEVFRTSGNWLREFAQSGQDLTSYVIGALNTMDPLLSPGAKIRLSDGRMFTGLSAEKNNEIREELLKTTNEDLIRASGTLDSIMQKAYVCVVGPQEAVDQCGLENLTVYSI